MNFKNQKGFTIIELIVVIAIIAILATIVLVNVTTYIESAKVARVNADIYNLDQGLRMFYAQYGDFPYEPNDNGCSSGTPGCMSDFCTTAYQGQGEPYLTVDGTKHYLSDVYKSDWAGYNASYFVPGGFFWVWMSDQSGDGKIDCAFVELDSSDNGWHGDKTIICGDAACPCDGSNDVPFRIQAY